MRYRFTRARALDDTAEIVSNRRYIWGILPGYVSIIPGNGIAAFTHRANAIARKSPATNPEWMQ